MSTSPAPAPGPATGPATGSATAPGSATRTGPSRRDLVAVNIGNALEWFDWNIYAIFAPFFAAQFFAGGDPVTALLSTLAVFAVGFFMRPVGGLVFGRLADRRGRRFSLTLAISLAALGSLLIGVAPTQATVGVLAPVVLVLARMLQGLAHGGETGGALTYLAEIAPDDRRGMWAASPWIGVATGAIMATGLGALLTGTLGETAVADWGWRIPFLLGALIGVYAIYIRRTMSESDEFEAGRREGRTRAPWSELLSHGRASLFIVALTTSGVVVFYTWFIFAPSYAVSTYGTDPTQALIAGVIAQSVLLCLVVPLGRLSDRIGRRTTLQVFSLGFVVVAFGLDEILSGGTFWHVLVAMTIAAVLISFNCAPLGATFAELVPLRMRATVIGIAYATSAAVFGGTAPYLNTWLRAEGLQWLFTGYMCLLCLITAVAVWRMPESAGRKLAR